LEEEWGRGEDGVEKKENNRGVGVGDEGLEGLGDRKRDWK
jgi:hypothetical protein